MPSKKSNSFGVLATIFALSLAAAAFFSYTFYLGQIAVKPDLSTAFPAVTKLMAEWHDGRLPDGIADPSPEAIQEIFQSSINQATTFDQNQGFRITSAQNYPFHAITMGVFRIEGDLEWPLILLSYQNTDLKLPKTFNVNYRGIPWRAFRLGPDNIIVRETSEILPSSQSLNFLILDLKDGRHLISASRLSHVQAMEILTSSFPLLYDLW